jgi:protein-S-isoprenylcysteine O-methyltransferase Ste14
MWPIIMTIVCSIWILSEVLINLLTRSKKSESNSYERNSLGLIWIVIAISITSGVIVASHYPHFSTTKFIAGITLIILGMIFRIMAIFSLKSLFTSDVSIHRNHRLKTDGMYKKIRHPSYSASLLSFLGLGIMLGNWVSLCIVFGPVLSAFLYRIYVEENILTDNFKEDYLDYKKKTKKLIPYLF